MRWTNFGCVGACSGIGAMGKHAVAVGALLAVGAMGASAGAQCIGYSVAPGTGTFVAGTTDIGLHADDLTLQIALPFNVSFYGTSYSAVTVSSNGNLQFAPGAPNASFTNDCLPSATIAGPVLFPFWDDLYTTDTAGGQGIFTDLSGVAGSRVFVIEWRAVYCCGTGAPINDFEVKFYENSNSFDVVYSSTMADRGSATIGCQMAGAAGSPSTQFVCNTAGPAAGDSLHFNCVGSATAGACCTPSNLACLFTDAAGCAGNNGTFSGVGTACATANCPSPGACCVPATQTCVQATGAACTAQGGTYNGNSTTCATANCPFGACCVFCASCTVQTPAACSALTGTYLGNGSACSATSCTASGGSLVANGDFETGSFSGWTQFGDLGFTAVNTGAWVGISPHGGTFEAHFGPTGTTGGIQQTLTANPGDQVTISFWYACVGTPNSFSADFDGQNLTAFTNDVDHTAWTPFVFTATVTNANPLLSFTTFNPPSYDFLDDISVCVRNLTNGACCNNSTGECTSTTPAGCPSGGTFQGLGTSCSPNPCPQPPPGVCCRGATCSMAYASAAACAATLLDGQNAGSTYPITGACNAGGSTSMPCCYADYNKVNSITVQDIFDYLQDWFAGSAYAATGSNGTVGLTTQQLFDFLNAWFTGGCS